MQPQTRRGILALAAGLVAAPKVNAACAAKGVAVELKPNCKYVIFFDPRQVDWRAVDSLCNWMSKEGMESIALPVLPEEDGTELESAVQIMKFVE